MIKLIVTDVDGTLVEDGFTNVDPRLFDTILKLREKGIQFAVASGRPWASVERTFEPVKKKVFYISNNGSYIGCYGRSLYVYAMDREIVKRLIHAVRKNPEFSMVYAAEDGDYTESKDDALCNWLVESYKFNLHRVDDLLTVPVPCTKLSIYRAGGVEEAVKPLVEEFKDILQISCAGDVWLEM
jgi:hydroxymethylpyrimidine pyrophosphatase-like HAD family hydrolase